MQGAGHGLQVELGILLAQYLAGVGVDKYIELAPGVIDHELAAAFAVDRRQVLADMALWISGLHAAQLLFGAEAVMGRGDSEQVVVEQGVELGLEQVDDPGQGQQDHERGDKQPGVEMPAPGQVVERRCWSAHVSGSAR